MVPTLQQWGQIGCNYVVSMSYMNQTSMFCREISDLLLFLYTCSSIGGGGGGGGFFYIF